MFSAIPVFLKVISSLVVGFGLNAGAHAQTDVVLVGAAFVDLKCWREVMSTVNPPLWESLDPPTDRWLKEALPKQFSNPLTSTELPGVRAGLPATNPVRFVDFLEHKSRHGPDLRKCFVGEDKLPIYAKHVTLTENIASVEKRVKELEEKYAAARTIELDLVARLTRMKESMSTMEDELARLRSTPGRAQGAKPR